MNTTDKPATFDDAMSTLRRWYYDEIRSLAAEAVREFPFPADENDDDENEEPRADWLHETIDGHEFVIYTVKAQAVILASDSHDAMEDETGEKGTDEQRAYFAMLADVREQIEADRN